MDHLRGLRGVILQPNKPFPFDVTFTQTTGLSGPYSPALFSSYISFRLILADVKLCFFFFFGWFSAELSSRPAGLYTARYLLDFDKVRAEFDVRVKVAEESLERELAPHGECALAASSPSFPYALSRRGSFVLSLLRFVSLSDVPTDGGKSGGQPCLY